MTGSVLAQYLLQEKIGEGGMGVVYKARDTKLGRVVAIKVLPPEKVADPERKRRFIQEAKAASALNHPNIITVHDVWADQAPSPTAARGRLRRSRSPISWGQAVSPDGRSVLYSQVDQSGSDLTLINNFL